MNKEQFCEICLGFIAPRLVTALAEQAENKGYFNEAAQIEQTSEQVSTDGRTFGDIKEDLSKCIDNLTLPMDFVERNNPNNRNPIVKNPSPMLCNDLCPNSRNKRRSIKLISEKDLRKAVKYLSDFFKDNPNIRYFGYMNDCMLSDIISKVLIRFDK